MQDECVLFGRADTCMQVSLYKYASIGAPYSNQCPYPFFTLSGMPLAGVLSGPADTCMQVSLYKYGNNGAPYSNQRPYPFFSLSGTPQAAVTRSALWQCQKLTWDTESLIAMGAAPLWCACMVQVSACPKTRDRNEIVGGSHQREGLLQVLTNARFCSAR